MKKLFALIVLFLFVFAGMAMAASIELRWNANTENDLAGYKVYRSIIPGNYGWVPATSPPYNTGPSVVGEGYLVGIVPVDLTAVPPIHPTNFVDENLEDGHWYYVVTAFDIPIGLDAVVTEARIIGQYNESGFSNEVNQRIDTEPPGPPGDLTIWEVILAFFKRIISWFA